MTATSSRTTVHLLRHGEVDNPTGILYGRRAGFGLTTRGQEMAERVAEVMHGTGHDVRAVIASPLQRAQETAAPTARAFDLPVRVDERLIEAGNDFEGEAVHGSLAYLAHPRFWRRYVDPLRPSWGEPYTDVAARMRDAVVGALNLRTGGEVLMVSHQLPIWTTRRLVERKPLWHDPRARECALASITSLSFEGRTLVGLSYWEPAADLVAAARDITPGTSAAAVHTGR